MCIMQDICGLEQTREWTHDRLYQTTKYLTGMPGGKGGLFKRWQAPGLLL